MRYKKGDRVRVRNLEWYNANKNSKGVIILQDWRIFEESMSEFCGKVVTIDSYSSRGNYYDIKEDGKVNYWSDDMFEGLAIEKPQEKMVSLDDVCSWIDDVDISKYLSCIFSGAVNISFKSNDFIRDLKKAMEE
jgi:hypothetical protein